MLILGAYTTTQPILHAITPYLAFPDMHSGINMSGAIGLRSYHTLPFAAPRHALQHSARQLKCCSLSRDSVTTLVKVLSQQGASQLPVVVSTLTTVWQHVEPLVARAKPQLQACLSVVACLSLSMIAAALLKTCGIGWRTAVRNFSTFFSSIRPCSCRH